MQNSLNETEVLLALNRWCARREQIRIRPNEARTLGKGPVEEMVQPRNGNLQLLLARGKTNGGQNLRVRNEYGRQKLLQIVAVGRLSQSTRLALDLVNVPLGHILQQLLKLQKHLIRIRLLHLGVLEHIKKILLERRQHILAQLLRVLALCLRIHADPFASNIHAEISEVGLDLRNRVRTHSGETGSAESRATSRPRWPLYIPVRAYFPDHT